MYDMIVNASEVYLDNSGMIPNCLRAHPLVIAEIKAKVPEQHLVLNRGHMGIYVPMGILMFESDPEAPQDNIYVSSV